MIVLHLLGNPSVASTTLPSLLWQAFMMCYVNKATPIHFIDDRCHKKQLKAEKSHKTCLTNHTQSTSHHIMPLVINVLGVNTQTDRHTY